ncbi:MAG: GAF domain-containing protein [Chloroflexota bacterium]
MRNAFIVILVYFVATTIAASYLTSQAIQTPSWQLWTAALATISLCIAGVVASVFIWRRRPETGIWFMMTVSYLAGIAIVTTVSGISVLILVSSVFFSSMVAIQALRSRQVVMFISGVVVGALALFIDFFIPIRRVEIPTFEGLINLFIPIILLVFGAANFRQFRRFWTTGSIQTKIVLWAGIGFFLSSAFIIGYAGVTILGTTSRSAEETARGIAREKAAEIQMTLERALRTAETFTQSVLVVKTEGVQLSRDQVNAMLKQMLKDNPQYVGVDVLWEPNAFDGMDARFVNAEGSDSNGRFLPYWTRDAAGQIQVELLKDYDISDWYQCPKTTKVPCLIDPYLYPVQGKDVWMTSLVVPFVVGDTFYGITGVDTPVSFLQDLADKADIFNGVGSMVILSNNGTILGVTGHPELIGQPATAFYDHFTAADYQVVRDGVEKMEFTTRGDEDMLAVFVPIRVGQTVSPWSVTITIPQNVILADARRQMWNMIGIGGTLLVLSLVALFYTARQIARPIRQITDAAQMVAGGNLNVVADVKNTDETGILASAFNQMTAQMHDLFNTLESRVAERTRNLELAAEVGRAVSQVRALDIMLTDAAELIRKQFDLYYTQVYLVDPGNANLVLQAGTGEVGGELLRRRHSLSLNANSINGRAAVERSSVVISDTTASATFKPNPLLPKTRSEMAVPLLIGNQVVGVLDMQSDRPGALDQEILPAFEALAGQLAVAIQNARLLAEAEEARREVEIQARRLSRVQWMEYLDAIHKPEENGYVFEGNTIAPLASTDLAAAEGALVSPIAVSGERLGSLVVEWEGQPPSAQASKLTDTVARLVSQRIEALRLLESAERYRAEAEQASRRLTHEGWQDYLNRQLPGSLGYLYDLKEVRPYREGDATQLQGTMLDLPLKVREEIIGKLAIQGVESGNEEQVGIAVAVAERLSAHIEGLRLAQQTEQALETTRNQARREQALRQITSAVRGSTDPAVILRTAARELGSILGRRTIVRLETNPTPQDKPTAPEELPDADGGTQ